MGKRMSEVIKASPYLLGAWKQGYKAGERESAIKEFKAMKEWKLKNWDKRYEVYVENRLIELGESMKIYSVDLIYDHRDQSPRFKFFLSKYKAKKYIKEHKTSTDDSMSLYDEPNEIEVEE